MDIPALVEAALSARGNAYAPYSGLRVGAALLTADGEIITGVNVENVSFGATCCAERTAIFSAVARGVRQFEAIAVASDLVKPIFPCGICRQVIAEFRIPRIIVCDEYGNYNIYRAAELLPHAFTEF